MKTVLVIDDQERCLNLCRQVMPQVRFLGPARSWAEAARLLRRRRDTIDAVLLDVVFERPDEDLIGLPCAPTETQRNEVRRTQGLHILDRLRAARPNLPVVLMTARTQHPKLQSLGSYTLLFEDDRVDARSVQACLVRALALTDVPLSTGPVYWGRDPTMGRVRQRLLATARGRPTVLLEGDTGTGKSLLARHVVHAATGRRGPFVSLDLATVPPDLMAARLFGVVRGAYTGATMDRPGAFEHAQGGTLFLDEIGNLTSEAQRLLLSVLQERRVTRLGCLREREVDVKVIAATNEDLLELVKRGVFRRDLLMRLNPSGRLRIPSLRERRGDLQGAVEHMLAVLTQDQELGTELEAYRRENSISSRSLGLAIGDRPPAEQDRLQVWFPHASWSRMHNHDWPGNLRELKSVLENVLWNILVGCAELAGVRRPDVLTVHPWQVVELLGDDEVSADSADEMGVCVQPQATLNGVSVDLERQVYRKLYIRSGGAFGEMALQLLGDAALGRKVQLRFNQLGLRVRDLKGLLH